MAGFNRAMLGAPQAADTVSRAAEPKPAPKKATAPPAGGGSAPRTPAPRTPATGSVAPPRPGSTKKPSYAEPPQSFPEDDEFGTSEQEPYSPEMSTLLGERESRSPLSDAQLAATQERIARVKELRSTMTPAGVPTWMPYGFKQDQSMSYAEQAKAQGFTQDKSGRWTKAPDRMERTLGAVLPGSSLARQPRVGSVPGAYGGTTDTGAGVTYPTSAELANPTGFRDAAVRYAAAYKAAQQATAGALSNQDELVKQYMGGRTMNPADPDYDAREVADARKRAERRQALETAQRGRELQGIKDTLRQYGYTDEDIDKL